MSKATVPHPGSAEVWIEAAARVFAEKGLSAISVEDLARSLGKTKGSFYWHFKDRAALVDAVIDRWETERTEAIISLADAAGTPRQRLATLLQVVSEQSAASRSELRLYVEAESEGVRPALERIVRRRIDYLADLLTELDIPRREAQRRSVLALSAAVGLQQLLCGSPDAMGRAAGDARKMTAVLRRMLLAPV